MAEASHSLEVPLLEPSRAADAGHGGANKDAAQSLDVPASVLNLTKCVLGAGLLSIPLAYSLLGAGLGTALFLGVALMTVFTIRWGQVLPSVSQEGALRHGTYSSMVMFWAGRPAELLLTFMMGLGLVGFEVSYNDIVVDILVGDVQHDSPGLWASMVLWLCQCAPYGDAKAHSAGEQPRSSLGLGVLTFAHATSCHQAAVAAESTPLWVLLALDRRLVLLAVVLAVVIPLSLQRHMASLSSANLVGLASLAAFLLCLVWLSGAALATGLAHAVPLLPDLEALGSTTSAQVIKVVGVLSVLLTANGCHANMHPLMSVMHPFSRARVDVVVYTTIAITTTYYLLVSVCSCIVFGQEIREDILTNLSAPALEPLVGPVLAHGMAAFLRVGYLLSILGSAVLTMFPLRQSVADLMLGPPPDPRVEWVAPTPAEGHGAGRNRAAAPPARGSTVLKAHVEQRAALHAPLTWALLALAYVLSVAIPSIWVVVSLIGSVSVTTLSFFMPALVGLRALGSEGTSSRSPLIRATLVFALMLGVLVFVNGFVALAP